MEIAGWIIVIALFIVGMAGAIFPILPGALAIYAAFFVYGFFISFSPFGFWFWTIQTLIVIVLFIADYAVSAWGVKKYGGSRASVIGSTIGILVGPFVIPAFGLILGPLLGAVIGELFTGAGFERSLKAGLGAVVGLFTSTVVKFILQGAMILIFFLWL
ncbi:DUF456 domain-containing protein [Paenibacillus sacheonensis]|uniref:DUF456 family protein n=1 Tax=Paenibacillus sacheonensis TaxID=742054 RepID=A0A7X4YNU7_9BACL|nr:DUF456 family protein [Paenibacillus sacheonensis]MBM7567424.1 uncharacterized protein YqgC (DUF456 family) [Paenibacillus sacheonensis]NBC69793.1 DUF456 family protein [Paenibacillus sacheonensis]